MHVFSAILVCCGDLLRIFRRHFRRHVAFSPNEDQSFVNSTSAVRRALLVSGILLLGLSAILLLGVLFKLLPADSLKFAGHSGLRGIGDIAVAGCLLAALGSNDG